MIRPPAVAGTFYPEKKRSLVDLLDRLLDPEAKKEPVKAAVVPHAGYLYSGAVAGSVYSRIKFPSAAVILGPNHTGLGKPFGLMAKGGWATPLGEMPVDEEMAKSLIQANPELGEDAEAHRYEHSIEVQLPFLQRLGGVDRFVPIAFQEAPLDRIRRLGEAIAQAILQSGQEALLLVSTDLTHYEPEEVARPKDAKAIEAILALEEEGLLETVQRHSISMCGVIPTAVGLVAAKRLGASGGTLVKYATSAQATGESDSVVGYGGILIQ